MGSDFDQKNSHLPQYTFGIGRNHYNKVYYETNKMIDKSIPGPGLYNVLKSFGSDGFKYSIRGKGNENIMENTKMIVPGPGEYAYVATSLSGKYPISKFKNTTNIIWGQSKEKKLQYSGN